MAGNRPEQLRDFYYFLISTALILPFLS